jgi:isopentenyl-diphosphate delta-isomerase
MSKTLSAPDSFELAQRKQDHIELTHKSVTATSCVDERFNYEPLFFTHPTANETWPTKFLNFNLNFPMWVSSMTGGSEKSQSINTNLAKLCGEFKLGMGLGSCRPLLTSSERFQDFAVRKYLGEQPLFANIGLAQLEELSIANKFSAIHEMVKALEANGLVIHINPLQEWFQPNGDKYSRSPIETIQHFLDSANYPVIVKEVGQGMGPKSLKALLDLPIAAIEFGAFGGTNFSMLESLRSTENINYKKPFINVGHTAGEMVSILNALPNKGKEFIISGGVRNVLDGYALMTKLNSPSVLGMASAFLAPAQKDYESLRSEFLQMKEALLVGKSILTLKGDQ